MIGRGIDWRRRWRHLVAGLALTIPLVAATAFLSGQPDWTGEPPESGLLKLSFTHSGSRDCRARTAEELAALARNMRAKEVCKRRRSPVLVEMDVDGRHVLSRNLQPSGLAGSGPSRIYESLVIPAGRHRVDLRMRDDPAATGFTSTASFDLSLAVAQSVAIDFDPLKGGFFLH